MRSNQDGTPADSKFNPDPSQGTVRSKFIFDPVGMITLQDKPSNFFTIGNYESPARPNTQVNIHQSEKSLQVQPFAKVDKRKIHKMNTVVDPTNAEPNRKVADQLIEPSFNEISSCGDDNES